MAPLSRRRVARDHRDAIRTCDRADGSGIALANAPGVRLLFDRGTLVLADAQDVDGLTDLPGVLWDPRVACFRAPAFRHAEVASGLASRGVRLSDETRHPAGIAGRWGRIDLRAYQTVALDRWHRAGKRGVVVLPTGSGKTRVGMAAMAGHRTALCLVPTRVLLDQWWRELGAVYQGRVGRLGDGQHDVAAITVSTYASALIHMAELGNRFDLIVVDEVHHFGNGFHDEALVMCTAGARLGLTATPISEPEAAHRIATLIGRPVYELTISDLAGTFLASFEIVTVPVDLTREERRRYDDLTLVYQSAFELFRGSVPDGTWRDFAVAATRSREGRIALHAWRDAKRLLSGCMEKRMAVGDLLKRHRDARVLIFVADNAAAYAISREHLVMPLTCDIGRVERAEALEAFRRGELRALVSARVLNEGLDVPEADVAIIVGGTFGAREHAQRVGRLLRPVPGKKAIVYELVAHATTEVMQAIRRRKGLVTRSAACLPHRR
jgi:superfamily II DNA or RNA helicase